MEDLTRLEELYKLDKSCGESLISIYRRSNCIDKLIGIYTDLNKDLELMELYWEIGDKENSLHHASRIGRARELAYRDRMVMENRFFFRVPVTVDGDPYIAESEVCGKECYDFRIYIASLLDRLSDFSSRHEDEIAIFYKINECPADSIQLIWNPGILKSLVYDILEVKVGKEIVDGIKSGALDVQVLSEQNNKEPLFLRGVGTSWDILVFSMKKELWVSVLYSLRLFYDESPIEDIFKDNFFNERFYERLMFYLCGLDKGIT